MGFPEAVLAYGMHLAEFHPLPGVQFVQGTQLFQYPLVLLPEGDDVDVVLE